MRFFTSILLFTILSISLPNDALACGRKSSCCTNLETNNKEKKSCCTSKNGSCDNKEKDCGGKCSDHGCQCPHSGSHHVTSFAVLPIYIWNIHSVLLSRKITTKYYFLLRKPTTVFLSTFVPPNIA